MSEQTVRDGDVQHDSSPVEDWAQTVWDVYEQVCAVDDLLARAKTQTAMLEVLRTVSDQISHDRREDVTLLNKGYGYSYGVLSDELGMTRGRIQQLVTGISSPKRPGVIEMRSREDAAEMRAQGASLEDIVGVLVSKARSYRGGDKMTAEQIAAMLDAPVEMVAAAI